MVVPITKKMIVVFVVVLATVVVSSNAAQRARLVIAAASQNGENHYEEIRTAIFEEGRTVNRVHARMMEMMNTDDYGRHNPSPSLAKPRYKLIPN